MMWTSSWRMLVHILGIAEVPLSKAPTLTLLVGHRNMCGSPFTHLLHTLRVCVHTCVCNVSGKKEFPLQDYNSIKK